MYGAQCFVAHSAGRLRRRRIRADCGPGAVCSSSSHRLSCMRPMHHGTLNRLHQTARAPIFNQANSRPHRRCLNRARHQQQHLAYKTPCQGQAVLLRTQYERRAARVRARAQPLWRWRAWHYHPIVRLKGCSGSEPFSTRYSMTLLWFRICACFQAVTRL